MLSCRLDNYNMRGIGERERVVCKSLTLCNMVCKEGVKDKNGVQNRKINAYFIWRKIWCANKEIRCRFCLEGFLVSCGFDMYSRTWKNMAFCYWIFGIGFCIPVSVIIICYSVIIKAVAKQVIRTIEKRLFNCGLF